MRWWALIIAVGIFAYAMFAPSLSLPEMANDEAVVGVAVQEFLHNETRYDAWFFLGRFLPVVNSWHHGALEVYLFAPFVFFGNESFNALRLGYVVYGVVSLVLVYWFGRRFFNPFVGNVSVLCMATNAAYFDFVKQGGLFGVTMPIFVMGSLLCFLDWHERRRAWVLYLGAMLFGLGWNVKGWYVWFIVSFIVAACVWYFPRYRQRMVTVCVVAGICVVTAWPIAQVYMGPAYRAEFSQEIVRSSEGVNNLDLVRNAVIRVRQLGSFMDAQYVGSLRLWLKSYHGVMQYTFWFLFGLFALAVVLRRGSASRRPVFLLTMITGAVLCSSVTFTAHRPFHLMFIMPLAVMGMAAGLYEIYRIKRLTILALIIGIALVAAQGVNVYAYVYDLKQKRIEKRDCDVRMVTQWLIERRPAEVFSFAWSLWRPIEYLSSRAIRPYGLFSVDAHIKNKMVPIVRNAQPENVYVCSFASSEGRAAAEVFLEEVARQGKRVVELKVFALSSGEPYFVAYGIQEV